MDLVADLVVEHGAFNVADKDLTPLLAFRVAPDAAPVLEGRFAALVQIEIPVPGNVLTVSTVRFIDEKVTNREVFPGGDTDFLDLLIKNRCERPSDPTKPDNDFVIYYDLSFNYNGPKPIPYPVDGGQSTAREVMRPLAVRVDVLPVVITREARLAGGETLDLAGAQGRRSDR